MTKILAINGSYREGGITDQTLDCMTKVLRSSGMQVETIVLRDYPINFCLNCRECTQNPGEAPGQCVQQDGMQEIVDIIEVADGYILASPTNFDKVTAVYKRFMERLAVYAYWPWGTHAPQYRKAQNKQKKKAILVSSCAAPGLMRRLFFHTMKQQKTIACSIGAEPVGVLFTGLIAQDTDQKFTQCLQQKASRKALRLVDKHR